MIECMCVHTDYHIPGLEPNPPSYVFKGMLTQWEQALTSELVERMGNNKLFDEMDWFPLVTGWATGRGFTPDDALGFALHIRYHTALG